VITRFGKLDILVNNAGVFVTVRRRSGGDVEALGASAGGQCRRGRRAVRAAAPVLPAGGRIITIGSVVGTRVGFPGLPTTPPSKAAVAGYTRGWARDLGPKGITVNVVPARAIDTDMNPADGAFAPASPAWWRSAAMAAPRKSPPRSPSWRALRVLHHLATSTSTAATTRSAHAALAAVVTPCGRARRPPSRAGVGHCLLRWRRSRA